MVKQYQKSKEYYESYSYYKKLYRANLRNILKRKPDYTAYGTMFTEEEFSFAKDLSGLNLSELVYSQTHYYRSRDIVKNIQSRAKLKGFKLTEDQINNREFPPEWWEQIKKEGKAYRERTGASSREMLAYISYEFYGS